MDNLWYQNAVFYGVDVRRFCDSNGDGFGDLQGLINSLDYLAELDIDGLWLLPIYDTPLLDNGYDIRDYMKVDPRVGTLADFIVLVEEAKKRRIRIVMDLVMNHTSNEHPWFQAARRDPHSRYRDYYIWSESPPPVPPDEDPVFPGVTQGVWTYDDVAQAYYFHRFYRFQPGLRLDNPHVQEEVFRVVDFWMSFGIAGFRMDAAPLMLEEKGLPDTRMEHPFEILRNLHRFMHSRLADFVLMGEVNLPLTELFKYFGTGEELTMLLNFMSSVHVFLALARQLAEPMRDLLKGGKLPPPNCQWLNFLRSLDELSLERLPQTQREVIYQAFAPQEDMRIYNRGIRRRLAPMLNGNRQRIELAFSLLFTVPGSALIMYGDELGMGDDLSLPERNAVRNPMQWSDGLNAGFSSGDRLVAPIISQGQFSYKEINVETERSEPDSLLNWIKSLIAVRKKSLEIGRRPARLLDVQSGIASVLAHGFFPDAQEKDQSALIFFHNLASEPQTATVQLDHDFLTGDFNQLFGPGKVQKETNDEITAELPGYGYCWLRVQPKK